MENNLVIRYDSVVLVQAVGWRRSEQLERADAAHKDRNRNGQNKMPDIMIGKIDEE